MLYDLNKDKNQNQNISNHPNYSTLVSKYKKKLKEMRTLVNKKPI